jgi:hyperosmotically inducible protein
MNPHRNFPRPALLLLGAASVFALSACDAPDPIVSAPAASTAPQAAPAPAPALATDGDITRQVQEALRADDLLRGRDFDIETAAGEVRLRGEVETQAQKDHAAVVVRGVTGVSSVKDELTLKP